MPSNYYKELKLWKKNYNVKFNWNTILDVNVCNFLSFSRLIELEEGIEALDAAIEYKTDVIHSRQLEVRQSQALAQSEDNLINRLNSLNTQDTKSLLTKYFDKVVNLKEMERKLNLQGSEMEVSITVHNLNILTSCNFVLKLTLKKI